MQSRDTVLTAFPSHLPHVVKKRCDYGILSGKRVKGEPHRGDMARRDKETLKQQETLSKVQSGALCCLVFVCVTEKYNMHIRWNNIHFSQLRAVTYLSKLFRDVHTNDTTSCASQHIKTILALLCTSRLMHTHL